MKLNRKTFTHSLFCGSWGSKEQGRSPGAWGRGETSLSLDLGRAEGVKEFPSCRPPPHPVSHGNKAGTLPVGRKGQDQRKEGDFSW